MTKNLVYVIDGEPVAYTPWDDHEDDCIKRWHDFTNAAGKVVKSADFSPYCHLSDAAIRGWIAAGCPNRLDMPYKAGPMNPEEFERREFNRQFEEWQGDSRTGGVGCD